MSDKKKQRTGDSSPQTDDEARRPQGNRHTVIALVCIVAVIAIVVAAVALMPVEHGSTVPAGSSPAITASADSGGKANGKSDGGAENSVRKEAAAAKGDETCDHDWTITYKTVHHDAVTHTETVKPVYANQTTYHTVCNDCKQVIDGKADEHLEETGHSGYSTNVPITDEVLVSKGYTHEVTDKAAYDETVPDKMVCTKCGATRPVDSTSAVASAVAE